MLASLVLPGAALVRASFVRVNAFNSVDLPTFERPAKAIWAKPSAGISSARPPAAALVTNSVFRTFMIFHLKVEATRVKQNTAWLPPSGGSTLMRDGIVRNGRLNVGSGRGRCDRGQRTGERYLQHLVHRVDHIDVERVENVLGNVRE